jgi:hypothetical protein
MISSLYLHSTSQAQPLRIGVMVDGFEILSAFRQVLTDIQASDFARLELVIVNRQPSPPQAPAAGRLSRYMRALANPDRRRLLLYTLYQRLDERRMASPNPLEMVDCTDILSICPRLDVTPIAQRFVHRFTPEDVAAVRSCNLDVLLRFGFNILRGDVLTCARYGIWSFHHGDNVHYRGGPALFWEVVEGNPRSGVILQVLTEKLDDGYVLCKSIFSTARGLWRSLNVPYPYWGSTHFVIRKLHELHECGWEALKAHSVPPEPYQGKTKIYRAPDNRQMVRWLAPKFAGKVLARPFRREKVYHWRICLRRAVSPRMLLEPSTKWSDYRCIEASAGHFYADPFLLERSGQLWLFFEDYLYSDKRGRIVCAPVQPDLSVGAPTPCLEARYHLSYPCVFEHDGEVFMIPESARNGTVDLYRATEFPFQWELEKTLFRGTAVDTTPLFHGGGWYFFTTLSEPPGNAAFGALFCADRLTGEWALHPASPITTDVRYARSAGAIQRIDNRLLRPVQDCSENYGRRIHIEEILRLTPDAHESRPVHTIEPDWEKGLEGVHTYGYDGGVEVLDAATFADLRVVS